MKHPCEVGMVAALASGGRGYGQGSRGDSRRSVIHTAAARWRGAAVTACSHHTPRGDVRMGGTAQVHRAKGSQSLVRSGQGEG